ncbi:P-loop ATPase, Sll1717 family [Desulfosporosinus nitroreducens]|uniref:KAP NTPase domain-containing protein n=1 Tax=Desulfosporosinus nitroreducens TaxID=2018668 RepID=A0ABT8R140_9FIRM|nr:hypothetical protein [Desulfosporosinus nitroreducens]MDO0826008.1 hypothetical protein [Desulfosporosinus nitroreducens]
MNITFTEEQIQGLFGNLAAEDEDKRRLKEYFFKNDTYIKIHNSMPLRILVAHKGIGKSAIFRISYLENCENNILSLWVRPDDIAELGKVDETDDFLQLIRKWKSGLEKLIIELVLKNFDMDLKTDLINSGIKKGVRLLDTITSIVKKIGESIDIDQTRKAVVDRYLKDKKVIVYIDDLDRGWTGSKESITRISALLNAVRDMSNESKELCFRISLRSDVYYLVRTADESTDKIDGNVLWLSWTEHQLLVLLAKRVQSFLGEKLSEEFLLKKPQFKIAEYLYPVMENKFMGDGKWHEKPIYYILLSLIRRRPRDLVNLCTLAARSANEKNHRKINTEDWEYVFERYSQDRLQDTINEHRYELPEIERLLLGMKPSHKAKRTSETFVYGEVKLISKVNGITQSGKFCFSNGKEATAKDLIAFMYKINFIVGRKDASDGYIDRKYFEDNRYLSTNYVNFGYEWEVHPAFRWALYPESRDIFANLDLSALRE